MDAAQRKRILTRYLIEKSECPEPLNFTDEALRAYSALDKLLDLIGSVNDGFFNCDTLAIDTSQWQELTTILNSATTFKAGFPPILISVDEKKALAQLQLCKDLRQIRALPQTDYYHRATNIPLESDGELDALIEKCRAILYGMTQDNAHPIAFDPRNQEQISHRMVLLEKNIKSLVDTDPQKKLLKNQLDVFLDLNKVNQLKRINIPQEHLPAKIYCCLAESVGGVTEKLSLVSIETVKTRLRHLASKNRINLATYSSEREQYKLSTEAIIKLPKHGKVQEVQREAMALNISRLIGLNTALSVSIAYDGHPALFVPFDAIRLLQDFTHGKTFKASLGLYGQTYTHYSTIKPVGEGLQADCFLDDFGNALGLFHLCSDPDVIGKDCQNKGLINARSLYIFDLMILDDNNFKLDSRLSLQPDHYIMKHSRHGQGRNRTLFEDSSIRFKYASIKKLQDNSSIIATYANTVIEQHQKHIALIKKRLQTDNLNQSEHSRLLAELQDVELLASDAAIIKNKLLERIALIDAMFPKTTGNIGSDDILQVLILEKLLHNPVLFSDDGRPYKKPWTNRQPNNVTCIKEAGSDVQITFAAKVPQDLLNFIKTRGGVGSLHSPSSKVVSINRAHLNILHEGLLHPECRLALDLQADYLVVAELEIIKEAYTRGQRSNIINAIAKYRDDIQKKQTIPEKISAMNRVEKLIQDSILSAKDKGLGMHILKKLHFDVQQQLQKLMDPMYRPENLNQAFSAALKLDRVAQFNSVVKEALLQKKLTAAPFSNYLNLCIERAANTTNYTDSQVNSAYLQTAAHELIKQLQGSSASLLSQLGGQQSNDILLAANDPLAHLAQQLLLGREQATQATPDSPSPVHIYSEEQRMERATNG